MLPRLLGDDPRRARRRVAEVFCAVLAGAVGCSAAQPEGAREPAPEPTAGHFEAPLGGRRKGGSEGGRAPATSLAELPPLLHPVRDVSWLGVELRALERGTAGVRVERVFRGSPAARAGLTPGDVLLSLDGATLSEPQQVTEAVRQRGPGTRVSLGLERKGRRRLVPVDLTALPETEDLIRLHFVGQRAPDLGSLATVQGEGTWAWSQLEGRVVVVEFWARWCAVCRYLVPVMNRWHQRYRPQGATLLGITSDSVGLADRAARDLGMTYPIASDRSGKTGQAFAANQLPTVFVVDRRGIVRDVMVGLSEQRLHDLEELVERLLDEP